MGGIYITATKSILMLAILAMGMLVAIGAAQPHEPPAGEQAPTGEHPPAGEHPPDGGHPRDGGKPHDGGHHGDFDNHYDWLNPGGVSFYYSSWYSNPYYYPAYYTYPNYYNNYPGYYPPFQQSCSIWTDKPSYKAGEIVTIYCNVPTGTTASFIEYMPDGSISWQLGPKWINAGTTSRIAQAWYPTGQRRIVLQTSYGCTSTNYFSVY